MADLLNSLGDAVRLLGEAVAEGDWGKAEKAHALLGGKPARNPGGKPARKKRPPKKAAPAPAPAPAPDDDDAEPDADALLAETRALNRALAGREREAREPFRWLEVVCDLCRRPFRARPGSVPMAAATGDDPPRRLCNACQVGSGRGRRRG